MSLTTRCIHCQTVFRISLEQLQAHGGQVRCGRCMQVFNGLQALTPDAAVAGAPAAATAPAPAQPQPAPPKDSAAPPAPEPALPPTAASGAGPEPETPAAAAEIATTEAMESLPAAEAEAATETLREILPEPATPAASPDARTPKSAPERPAPAAMTEDNPFVEEAPVEPAANRRAPLLTAAVVLLAVLLAAQAVYFYRGDIAARVPWARQILTEACAHAGCTLSLPQNAKAVLIEASDLQVVDPAQPSRIQLTATLRNHAGHDVAYPALDLVLTNVNDHTLVRRIFLPAEYLTAGRDPAAGIAANAELTVRLAMETGNLGAAGFRLAVLPAPRH